MCGFFSTFQQEAQPLPLLVSLPRPVSCWLVLPSVILTCSESGDLERNPRLVDRPGGTTGRKGTNDYVNLYRKPGTGEKRTKDFRGCLRFGGIIFENTDFERSCSFVSIPVSRPGVSW